MSDITNQPFAIIPQIWHRDGSPYTATLQSGDEGFGQPDSEKQMDHHVTLLSSDSPSYPVAVMIRGGVNSRTVGDKLGKTLTDPQSKNMIPLLLLQQFLGDRLTVSGVNHFVKITGRIFHTAGVNSESFVRRS